MNRPDYLSKYKFDWEMIDVVIGGQSVIDAPRFFGKVSGDDSIQIFLDGYGINNIDPISRAELFGNFQEAIQFIKRYFLIEGNSSTGLDLVVPNTILMITDINELIAKATMFPEDKETKESLWAELILKVMHTILHVDKDLRGNYFKAIQTQIFDRFYRYIQRDADNRLYLGSPGKYELPLVDFETKAKKSRDSVILKLLHKVENVAEELFDRVGIRFVAEYRIDCLRLVEFLLEKGVIVPHNVKPSRSINSLINLMEFKSKYKSLAKLAIKNNLSEQRFRQALEREISEMDENFENKTKNDHSHEYYRSIQFTGRQLIRYKDPFIEDFNKFKNYAKKNFSDTELFEKLTNINTSNLIRDVEFFYPYEVQIIDKETHLNNVEGPASHSDYKMAQIVSARDRIFKKLVLLSNQD